MELIAVLITITKCGNNPNIDQWMAITGLGDRGLAANGSGVSSWDYENVLDLTLVMVAQICEYTKSHVIVHFKWIGYMVLHLNKAVMRNKTKQSKTKGSQLVLAHGQKFAVSCSTSYMKAPGISYNILTLTFKVLIHLNYSILECRMGICVYLFHRAIFWGLYHLGNKLSFSHWDEVPLLSNINICILESNSGLFVMFHGSICLCLSQYYNDLILETWLYVLVSVKEVLP